MTARRKRRTHGLKREIRKVALMVEGDWPGSGDNLQHGIKCDLIQQARRNPELVEALRIFDTHQARLPPHGITGEQRLVRIKNTLRLDEFWVSAGLLDEVALNPMLQVVAGPGPVAFDHEGNLADLTLETVG